MVVKYLAGLENFSDMVSEMLLKIILYHHVHRIPARLKTNRKSVKLCS